MFINKLGNFIKSRTGKYIISIVLGLGLASLFRKICDDDNCVIYKGYAHEEVDNKSFKHNDKCYKYSIAPVSCNKSLKIVDFA
jgi:hypothetical protein